ncbi:MAG: hypothetical protein JRI80_19615 [Deltaproteobacteria bacterium]|nr:hypothetical protein [Deltaproteobacteria bacterium]
MRNKNSKPVQGMFLLIDRKSDQGLIRWVRELEKRNIPALVLADGHTIHKNPDLVKRVADKGLDVGNIYNDGAFWPHTHDDMISWLPSWIEIKDVHLLDPYQVQYEITSRINEKMVSLTGKTMPAFSGKYFSYDENTMKIADSLEIPYILARGTAGEEAVFYQPIEFRVTLISVSNVQSKELGTGSLCDESLRARKETPDDFRRILHNLDCRRVILVAQSHISGLMQEWWDVYQDFFDRDIVQWQALEDFVTDPGEMPYREIPVNTRTDYMQISMEEDRKERDER